MLDCVLGKKYSCKVLIMSQRPVVAVGASRGLKCFCERCNARQISLALLDVPVYEDERVTVKPVAFARDNGLQLLNKKTFEAFPFSIR